MGMGVKPMSPSANFTTYRLPTSSTNNDDSTLPRPKATTTTTTTTTTSGLFRFLLCSRPCFHQHSVDDAEEENNNAPAGVDFEENHPHSHLENGSDHLRTELQAVMRHLEVRWQLFDEALSRFGDLEAMLAICAEKVRWRHQTTDGVKDAHVAEDLRSLIARKLSMEVSIKRITQLSSTGELGVSLDKDGHLGQLQSRDKMLVQAALDFFYESSEEIGSGWLQSSQFCVLEEDAYTLCNQKGEVVEEGKQVVIWEQYNATWYICGCVSYPATSKWHA